MSACSFPFQPRPWSTHDVHELAERLLGLAVGRGEFLHLDELGPEHDSKMRGERAGEGDVGDAAALEQLAHVLGRRRLRGVHATAELAEALLADRGEDGRAIFEVMVGRLVADAGAARDLAHAEGAEPLLIDERDARVQNARAQVLLVDRRGRSRRRSRSSFCHRTQCGSPT